MLSELHPFPGRQDCIQNILAAWLGVHRGQLLLLSTY
jgi:hypothetical protein